MPAPPAPIPPVITPPVIPPVQPPISLIQLIVPSAQLIPTQQIQPAHVPELNWLHFKPEFAGSQMSIQKYIFSEQMIGWTHMYFKKVSNPMFCLALVGEARLCYESLKPINVDWIR